MAGNTFNLRVLITAIDRLSPALRNQARMLNQWQRSFARVGKGGVIMGAGLAAALAVPTRAFIEAENAATQLQNTLMTKDGLAHGFGQINQIAIELGNKLPGTTADFASMASVLKSLGVSTDVITNGGLKAAAYLAVVGKPLGVTYEQAAQSMGKLANAFGASGQELIPLADSLQRTIHMGADLEQMGYAMARIAGPLKAIGKQGMQTANEVIPLVALLTKSGISGEEAGTGIGKMLNVFVMHGKFKGIPEMVKSLEAMNKMEPSKKLAAFKSMFGALHAPKAMIIAAGGYDQMIEKMKEQASLQQRINNSLGTLGNLWEAATGTFTNAMVAFAEAYAPELKQLSAWLNDMAVKLMDWSKANGPAIRAAITMVGALTGVKLAALGVAFGIRMITVAMRMNPIMLFVQAMALAAPLIIENWELIKLSFKQGIDNIIEFFQPLIRVIDYLAKSVGKLLPDFSGFGGGMSLGQWLGQDSSGGMRRPSILQSQRSSGTLDVNFNNAPAGTRVVQGASSGLWDVKSNVGYRSLGMGGAW